jgi:UDP-glucose 4-epimerase
VLGAKSIQVQSGLLGALVDLSWRARLQPIDRGWLDLAFSVPLLDCARAARNLDWRPQWSSTAAFADVIEGVAHQAHAESPPLRRRSMIEQLRRDATVGPITTRHLS